jgi:RNA polymerase sigma-70 factor, ECF subfamily
MIVKEKCENSSDEELVVKTLTDQEFYYCLVIRYEEALKRYIKRITNIGETEVEDVLQNVFLKAYLNLNDFDADLKFSSWLYRIAHNEAISNHRKRSARHMDDVLAIDDGVDLPDMLSLERELDVKLTVSQIGQVLAQLDEKYREVLVLKFIEEKDYTEISDILQKPIGTVGTLISRAKKQFKAVANKNGIKF